jgi:hypothetical protein
MKPTAPLSDQSSGTRDVIAPILRDTYGKGSMVESLADHLAQKIDAHDGSQRYSGSREDMVFRTCWDWFSGGSTAEAVAEEIEAALAESLPLGNKDLAQEGTA